MTTKYNAEQTKDIFTTNALAGIPEEQTALGIARRYQKEEEWNIALAELKKGSAYRQSGKSLLDLLDEVCTQKSESNLVLYSGSPQVHDYDEKHLLVEGISSVSADGKVVESYGRLLVMKEVFRDRNGAIQFFTLYQAIKHCEEEGYFLPPLPLTCAVIAALFKNKSNPQAEELLLQHKNKGNGNGWHAQNTVINYDAQKTIHYPRDADFPNDGGKSNINASLPQLKLPFEKIKKNGLLKRNNVLRNKTLEEGLQDPLVNHFVKQFTGLADPSILIQVGQYFQRTAKVWFPTGPVKAEDCTETRAAWFGCYSNLLYLDGNCSLNFNGAARGVRCAP